MENGSVTGQILEQRISRIFFFSEEQSGAAAVMHIIELIFVEFGEDQSFHVLI